MSKDYVADNAGTGFASFDDDGPSDLDSLLAGAALGEEEDDQETASYFSDADPSVYTSNSAGLPKTSSSYQNSEPRKAPRPAAKAPSASALTIDDEEDYDDLPAEEPQQTYTAPAPVEPVYEAPVYTAPAPVEPAYEAPVNTEPAHIEPTRSENVGRRSWERDPMPLFTAAPVAPQTPVQSSYDDPRYSNSKSSDARKLHIPSEADEIAMAGKIIRILDAYRKLSGEVQTVASQFITNGSEVIEDEATLVIKVLNADPMLSVTMKALREAKDLDDVERVFYIISLENDVLHSLGGLVSVFNDSSLDESLDKINYSRALVKQIDQLDSRAVNYVESTESILAAAAGESN